MEVQADPVGFFTKRWCLYRIVVLIGMFCGVQLSSVWAAEWSLLPSIGVKGVYNDNLVLTPLPHKATYGYWVSPAAEFSGKTERLEVSGRIAADFVSYYGGRGDAIYQRVSPAHPAL